MSTAASLGGVAHLLGTRALDRTDLLRAERDFLPFARHPRLQCRRQQLALPRAQLCHSLGEIRAHLDRDALRRQQPGNPIEHARAVPLERPQFAVRLSPILVDLALTRTTCQTPRSPCTHRYNIAVNVRTSSRSVFARRARRFTSILAESTTRLHTPSAVRYRWIQNPSRPAS